MRGGLSPHPLRCAQHLPLKGKASAISAPKALFTQGSVVADLPLGVLFVNILSQTESVFSVFISVFQGQLKTLFCVFGGEYRSIPV